MKRTPLFSTLLGLAMVLGVAQPAAAAPPEEQLKKAGEEIVNFAVPGLGSSIFGSHSKIPPYQINGKWVYALPLVDEDGSRCTLNFDAKWKEPTKFTVYILGVTPEVRATMQFQRKGDKKWSSDSDRGPVFKHGDVVVLDGGKNYLAQRGFGAGDVLRDFNHVAVVFLQEGLSFDEFIKQME